METNEEVVIDTEIDTETTENTEDTETTEEIDVEALKKENATLKAQKEHWRKKAERPEATETETTQGGALSQKDVIYLASAQAKGEVHEDDLEDLTKHMEKYHVGAKEALAFLKPIFKERNEERKTAEVTQTRGRTGGNSKITPEVLLEQAEKGKLPESDDEIAKLALARRQRERAHLGK